MKHFLITGFCLLSTTLMYAQATEDVVLSGSRKTTKGATPQQVIDSLEHRFPNAQAVQYYETSAKTLENGWAVTEEKKTWAADEVTFYTLNFKRDDFNYYAVYDKEGHLMNSKYEQKLDSLPTAVISSIKKLAGDKYKEYDIISETYYKTVNYSKSKEYYEIKAINKANKKIVKTIIMAPDGTLIKVKG